MSKAEIDNGNAEKEAASYLALNLKQKAMEDSILQARRVILDPPYPSLPACLVNLLEARGIPLTIHEAIEYIKASPTKKTSPTEHYYAEKSSAYIKNASAYIGPENVEDSDLSSPGIHTNDQAAARPTTSGSDLITAKVPKAYIDFGGFSLKGIKDYFPEDENINFMINFFDQEDVHAHKSQGRIKISSGKRLFDKYHIKQECQLKICVVKHSSYYRIIEIV